MPRPPRPDVADVPQHVIQRGNDCSACFRFDEDYRRYLFCLRESALRSECAVHAYVLMTNHVHLLVTPRRVGGVSQMMQSLGRNYVPYFNQRHGRTGTLWEGRHKSRLVADTNYLMTCYRYIEQNPVRAAMVAHPRDYFWSSYACNALGKHDPVITPHPVYLALGDTTSLRQLEYCTLVHANLPEAQLDDVRSYLKKGRIRIRP